MNKFLNRIVFKLFYVLPIILLFSCKEMKKGEKLSTKNQLIDANLNYLDYTPNASDKIISRSDYANKLYGFWLGQCIANWTGLVTEMDKIGNIGEIKTGDFYTRDDWGKPDKPSIWGQGIPSNLSENIVFVFEDEDGKIGRASCRERV